jgi:hypothetical protein
MDGDTSLFELPELATSLFRGLDWLGLTPCLAGLV